MNARISLLKNRIAEVHSPLAIAQTVFLYTQKTTVIDELTDAEIEAVYKIFFPMEEKVAQQLIHAKSQADLKYNRSKILTIATRLGIKEPDSWTKFNEWMLSHSIYKKKLNDHTLYELNDLYLQFRGMESNYNKSAQKPGTKAWYHKNKLVPPSSN